MKRIFISHASADSKIADKLAEDLTMAGHEVRIDTKDLTLGSNVIDFMNDGIEGADAVIILYSKHSAGAKWQKQEINAAIWREVSEAGATCILLRLDGTRINPLLGPKVWGPSTLEIQVSIRHCWREYATNYSRKKPQPQ